MPASSASFADLPLPELLVRCRQQEPAAQWALYERFFGPMLLVARAAGIPVRAARMWSEGDQRGNTPARRARRAVYRRLLRYAATDDDTAAALEEHAQLVADEVLATDYAPGEPSWAEAVPFREGAMGLTFWLRKA